MKMERETARRIMRIAWILAIAAAIVGSLLPSTSLAMRTLNRLPVNDKLQHLAVYAMLVLLPALHERRGFVAGAAVGAIALGVGLEFAQRATGWRDFEIADMAADAIGACGGLLIGSAMRARMHIRSSVNTAELDSKAVCEPVSIQGPRSEFPD